MPYNINRSNGTTLGQVADQTINTSLCSLALVGRGAGNYGELTAENLVKLLENFSSASAPAAPMRGQIWYDSANDSLMYFDGTTWRGIGLGTGTGGPDGNVSNNTITVQGNGVSFALNNPSAPTGQRRYRTLIDTPTGDYTVEALTDGGASSGVILQMDTTGLRMNAAGANRFVVNTTGATILGNLLPDGNNTRNLGSTSLRFSNVWATTFQGRATSASYADLAERYHADAHYEPGTLVEIGGDNEITRTTTNASTAVFGVISTNPAFRMNEDAGDDATHPFVALSGRVPVKVVGTIRKGQRLVSSTFAGVATGSTVWDSPNAVFGRALADYDGSGIGVIECVVGVR